MKTLQPRGTRPSSQNQHPRGGYVLSLDGLTTKPIHGPLHFTEKIMGCERTVTSTTLKNRSWNSRQCFRNHSGGWVLLRTKMRRVWEQTRGEEGCSDKSLLCSYQRHQDATERKVGGRSQESQISLNKNSVGSVCLNSGEYASSDVHQSTGACTRDHESIYPCSLSTPLNNLTQISHKRLSTESGLADLPMGSSFPGEPPMSLRTTLTHFMIGWHRAF